MTEPIKKNDLVRDHISAGRYKQALAIVKTFRPLRGGASKAEIDTMTRAYECMVYARTYVGMGVNIDETIKTGVDRLVALYGRN